jgi:UDP-N-acetylmuramoyl-tripeptide--D-alanyl-D-alanine ligase
MVLPSDGPAIGFWRGAAVTFGTREDDAARLIDTRSDSATNRVTMRVGGQDVTFTMHAPGAHMAMNAACALAVASTLGLDLAQAAAALEGFAPVTGRGARCSVAAPGGSAILLDESYNASAVSVRAALSVLALQPAARRVAVLGDMLELGEHSAAEHESLAPDVERSADLLFTCGPAMRLLHDAVRPAIRGEHAADSATLAPIVAGALRADDAVLVKGSLGSRMKLVVQAIEAAG